MQNIYGIGKLVTPLITIFSYDINSHQHPPIYLVYQPKIWQTDSSAFRYLSPRGKVRENSLEKKTKNQSFKRSRM